MGNRRRPGSITVYWSAGYVGLFTGQAPTHAPQEFDDAIMLIDGEMTDNDGGDRTVRYYYCGTGLQPAGKRAGETGRVHLSTRRHQG